MEFYPGAETQQLAPLVHVVLPGGPVGSALQQNFETANLAGNVWDNIIIKNRLSSAKYIIRYRTSVDETLSRVAFHKEKEGEKHSRLSPFNNDSDLFPNGILSERWFTKYTEDVPFASVCCYDLPKDSAGDQQLGQKLLAQRTQLAKYGVRLIAIIVSESGPDTGRLATLRQISGLANLSGFFFISTAGDFSSEAESLCSSVIGTLKISAVDFYSSIEYRVKQRFKKFYNMPSSDIDTVVQLSPKFLEARNLLKQAILLSFMHPNNMDSSLPLLESAYKSIFELLAENSSLSSKTNSPHDTNLYWSWRTLLDVLAIHLVRAYFSIEDPIAALKKHKHHVESVPATFSSGGDNSLWVATQYHWLADLLSKIPKSALRELEVASKKAKGHLTLMGGVSFGKNARLITFPNLLYAKAASGLSANSPPPASHIKDLSGPKQLLEYKIRLLETARSVTDSDYDSMKSFKSLLTWTIAECYSSMEKFDEALSNYALIVDSQWSSTSELASRKIISIYERQGNTEGMMSQLAKLSTSKRQLGFPAQIPSLPSSSGSIELKTSNPFLHFTVSLFNAEFSEETHVFDTICTQLQIKSIFNADLIRAAYPKSKVSLSVSSLTLHYDNNSRVTLSGGGSDEHPLQHIEPKEGKGSVNFSAIDSDGATIDLHSAALESGWFALVKIEAQIQITIEQGEEKTLLNHHEVHLIDQTKTPFSQVIAVGNENTTINKSIRLNGRSPARILVKPFHPKVKLQRQFSTPFLVLGEALSFPIEISSSQLLPPGVVLNKTTIELKCVILEHSAEVKNIHASVNWDNMKDDEPFDITELIRSGKKQLSTSFNASVRSSPNVQLNNRQLTLAITLNLCVADSSGEISFYNLDTYELPVVSRPFESVFTVTPRKAPEGQSALPNPFVLSSKSDDLSMPSPHRYWTMKVKVDSNDLLKDDVTVVDVDATVKSASQDIHIEWLDELEKGNGVLQRSFTTGSRHRYTPKNVTVVGNAKISYKRLNSERVSVYESDELEFVLPLQTPRVLLEVKPVEDRLCLEYSIENPTARILTFTTNLSLENAEAAGVKWAFDESNETPLKQPPFPVLPFSEHRMTYMAKYTSDNAEEIELPFMSVFDMNYKVSLATVSLQEHVQARETGMRLTLI